MHADANTLQLFSLAVLFALLYTGRLVKGSPRETPEGLAFPLKPLVLWGRALVIPIYCALFLYPMWKAAAHPPKFLPVLIVALAALILSQMPGTIVLKYAVIGDTDLDGADGLSDYTAVVRNFGVGTNWDQGAVTYGAAVGLDDYTAVVRNFGQSTPAAAPAVTAPAAPDVSAVPTTSATAPTAVAPTTVAPTPTPAIAPVNSTPTATASASAPQTGANATDQTRIGRQHSRTSRHGGRRR